eukprot:IDg9352t1
MGVPPKFAASIWNGRSSLTQAKPLDVLTVFVNSSVLCGDMMIFPERWVATVTHCRVLC